MNPLFSVVSPSLVQASSIFIYGGAAALVGVHAAILALAGARTTLPPRVRVLAPVVAALLLGAWLGWALVLAQERAAAGPTTGPRSPLAALPMLLGMLGAVAVGASFLASRTVRALNAAIPPAWLIRTQVYRAGGLLFIWPFMTEGMLPAGFALPAGIGDAITGLAAPFVAAAVARDDPRAHRWAVWWNWFGILDLIVAPTAAVFAGAQVAAIQPLGLIPVFLGPPLGILTHLYSLRNLAVNAARRDVAAGSA